MAVSMSDSKQEVYVQPNKILGNKQLSQLLKMLQLP